MNSISLKKVEVAYKVPFNIMESFTQDQIQQFSEDLNECVPTYVDNFKAPSLELLELPDASLILYCSSLVFINKELTSSEDRKKLFGGIEDSFDKVVQELITSNTSIFKKVEIK